MIILTVTAEKGGVGKSTTAVNLAARWALSGHCVGLIDLDTQGNATLGLGLDTDGAELRAALTEGAPLELVTSEYGVRVARGGEGLSGVGIELGKMRYGHAALRRALDSSSLDLDILIVDTPPTLGSMLTTAAITAATHVLVPAQCEGWGVRAVGAVVDVLDETRAMLGVAPELVGVLPTMLARTREGRDALAALREEWDELVCGPIRRRTAISQAMTDGRPVSAHAPGGDGDTDYQAAARELARRLGL